MITAATLRRSLRARAYVATALLSGWVAAPAAADPIRFVQIVENDVLGEVSRVLEVAATGDTLYVTARPPALAGTVLFVFARDESNGSIELVATYGKDETPLSGSDVTITLGTNGGFELVADDDTVYTTIGIDEDCLEPGPLGCPSIGYVARLSADAPGSLSLTSLTRAGSGVGLLTLSADGTRLDAFLTDSLRRYAVREDGTLEEVSSTSLAVRTGDGAVSADGRRLVTSGDRDSISGDAIDGHLTSIAVGADTDELRVVDTLDLMGRGVPLSPEIAISPDGRRLYGFQDVTGGRRAASGVVPYDIGLDGTMTSRADEVVLDENDAGALSVPTGLVISSDGRQIYASSRVRDSNAYVVTKHTVDGSGRPVARGENASGSDGVPDGALIGANRLVLSPDDAFLYVDGRTSVTVFAIHADTDVRIVGASADAGGFEHVVQVLNAGPATAHEVTLEFDASSRILAIEPSDGCTIAGNSASCTVDRVAERALTEHVVRTAPASGSLTFDASVSQIETDLRPEDNAARATTTANGDSEGLSEPAVGVANDGESSGGGGGCAITTSGTPAGFMTWLALVFAWRWVPTRAGTWKLGDTTAASSVRGRRRRRSRSTATPTRDLDRLALGPRRR